MAAVPPLNLVDTSAQPQEQEQTTFKGLRHDKVSKIDKGFCCTSLFFLENCASKGQSIGIVVNLVTPTQEMTCLKGSQDDTSNAYKI